MDPLQRLQDMRNFGGKARTTGLDDATITRFAATHPLLNQAIEAAHARHRQLQQDHADFLRLDEDEQIHQAQARYVNFYAEDAINPYLPAAAMGPWIVTLKGRVVHDNGGYGMLGFGHNPADVLQAMAEPQLMGNIMTASIAQWRFGQAMVKEMQYRRKTAAFERFMCLNSGSEAMTLAARIADTHSKHASRDNQIIKRVVVKGAFHGRTGEPAILSDSSRKAYTQNLASFRHEDSLLTVTPYDVEELEAVFAKAAQENWFIEAMYLEPVMGEGNPGRAVSVAFYQAARALTRKHDALLIVDSIQAGLRAHGVLSITNYPGFETLDAPDMETYSKVINAGQYPLSVLALSEKAAGLYQRGTYGNTMTTNPRALDVATTVLGKLDDAIRQNITVRGQELVTKLNALKDELGGLITKVQGTGLLVSCELAPQFKSFGADSIEDYMRTHGVGVIHGGVNSLRFTPRFAITEAEVDLIVTHVRQALLEGPRRS